MSMSKILKNVDWPRAIFGVATTFAVFLLGGVFASKHWQPYQMFEDGYKAAIELVRQQLRTRHDLVEPVVYAGAGVVYHDDTTAYQGLTLVQGLFPEGVEVRLLDMEGTIVCRWPVRFFEIWPEPKHVLPDTIPATDLNYHTQGMWLLRDGSVIINVSSYGVVKIDRSGEILWTVDRATHHSITPNPDGSFWVPVRSHPEDIPEELELAGIADRSARSLDSYEDRLIRISSSGTVEEEVSVLKGLFDGEFENSLFDAWMIKWSDPTHVNDIEVVTEALANRIVGVDEGDLLVSIRQMHMLAILDRETGAIKWHRSGPWVRQHDPDITDQGIIEVYDNGGEHRKPDQAKGSRIVALDPATDSTWTVYPVSGSSTFYSRIMGTHQPLANGNRLITESMAGRVFEVDESGSIVWDYVMPYDDEYAALIQSAIRYGPDYLSSVDGSCSGVGDMLDGQ